MSELAERFAAYLAHRLPQARDVAVERFERIYGGASRETYRALARWRDGGRPVERGMIVRRDPESSLIETERTVEFAAYRAFHGTAVPVPEPLFLETDPQWLDRPFFVMEEIAGCTSSARSLDEPPYSEHIDKIGEQKWRILGEIARADPAAGGLGAALEAPRPAECWSRELARWERVIDEDELTPQPIARAAIRRLRRRPPPPPPRLSVVHGDYRTGNFLFDTEGNVRAILDWEMCHVGDPLEDLAWAMDPLWAWDRRDRPGKLVPRERAIAFWEAASGLRAEPERLAWWELFASLKGLAIWISSSREFVDGRNQDLIMAFAGWFCTDAHDRLLVERLAPRESAT